MNCRLYEQETLRKVTGDAIRPGGLGLTERALSFCSLPPGVRVLDIACGTGATVQWLRQSHGSRAIGVDASQLLLQSGLCRCEDLPLACSQAAWLPLPASTFAAILIECSLSIMPDPSIVLQESRRALQPGGYLILSDIYIRHVEGIPELRALPVECCLRGAMGEAALKSQVSSQGFEICLWEDHSEDMRELTGRLTVAYGSLQEFWSQATRQQVDPFDFILATGRAKPGYCLLIARKPGDS